MLSSASLLDARFALRCDPSAQHRAPKAGGSSSRPSGTRGPPSVPHSRCDLTHPVMRQLPAQGRPNLGRCRQHVITLSRLDCGRPRPPTHETWATHAAARGDLFEYVWGTSKASEHNPARRIVCFSNISSVLSRLLRRLLRRALCRHLPIGGDVAPKLGLAEIADVQDCTNSAACAPSQRCGLLWAFGLTASPAPLLSARPRSAVGVARRCPSPHAMLPAQLSPGAPNGSGDTQSSSLWGVQLACQLFRCLTSRSTQCSR